MCPVICVQDIKREIYSACTNGHASLELDYKRILLH